LAQDLMAGVVDYGFVAIANVLGQIQAGSVRALAIASSARVDVLPGVPTLAEAGVSDVDADAWFAFFAPANTQSERISRLSQAIEAALAQEAVRTTLARNAVVLRWRSSEDMKKFVAAEVQKWAEVVRISGAKADM
jgi:tripartite-type tricarboxylate transporter receptor subunit TctC